MNNSGKIVLLALLAMITPPLVAATVYWDDIKDIGTVDPDTAQGYVLYFTAPG